MVKNTSRSRAEILQVLREDKSCTELYSKHVSKYFSPYCSWLFLQFGWSANGITFLMLLVGVAATPLLLSASPFLKVLGCIFLVGINVLDTSDGEVARYLKSTSRGGVLLDKVAHFVTNVLLFFALWYQCFRLTQSEFFVWVGVATLLAISLDEFLQELYLGISGRDENNSTRKEQKRALSSSIPSGLRVLFAATSSVVAFYHIYPMLVLLDLLRQFLLSESMVLSQSWSMLYVAYFSLVSIVKCLLRFAIIWKRL